MKLFSVINKSIRLKILSSVVATLALTVLFTTFYYPAKQKSMSMESVQTQVETLSQMLSFSVGMGLGESNFALVQTAFKWAQDDKNIIYILIQDESNSEIVSYNPKGIQVAPVKLEDKDKAVLTNNEVITSSTIKYKDAKLGKIVIVYSLDEVNAAISKNTLFSIGISLALFIIGVLAVFWVIKIITKQINDLNKAAKQVEDGNLDAEIKVSSQDEIGAFAKSFKAMVQSIKDANASLTKEKESIAVKVEEAVKESESQKKYLSTSIEKILVEMNKFADGDLMISLKSEKDDEIGRLFNGFNLVVKNIREMIIATSEAIEATASASTEISSSSEEMAAGAQEQSSQTLEIASSIEEMTRTILDTTRNSSIAAEAAKKSGDMAKEGGKVVSETIIGMNRIAEVVSKSAETVQALGKSSNQIGEIIQVIDEIADQTNLLALNAAIEAARAGEQGRGFAVVADEVRKLAERTTKATKEISGMIKQIQTDTHNAVISMEEGTSEVEKGKLLADKAGQSLKEIITGADQVVGVITQVAAASEEQSATSEQISKNIESINNVTKESADGVQQIARSAEDLSRLTVNLQELIARFKFDNASDHKNNSNIISLKNNSGTKKNNLFLNRN